MCQITNEFVSVTYTVVGDSTYTVELRSVGNYNNNSYYRLKESEFINTLFFNGTVWQLNVLGYTATSPDLISWTSTGPIDITDVSVTYGSAQINCLKVALDSDEYSLVSSGTSEGLDDYFYIDQTIELRVWFTGMGWNLFISGTYYLLSSIENPPFSNDWTFFSGVEYLNVFTASCCPPPPPPTPLPPHTNILASGVSNVEHIAAFDAMVEQRFANLDIEAVLIYLIDTVNASALPSLAAQFDVLGYKGYGLAQTEQQRREVIKRAIELHRFKGTPWSIKEALKAIGYYDAIIDERLVNPIYYDGTYNHNGSQIYGPGHWAEFRVKIDLGNDMGVTAQTAADAVALIHEYKNVRSKLRDVSYIATLNDYLTDIQEELTVNIEYTINEAVGYYHDNTYLYSGAITHGTITETITQTTN